MIRDEAEGGAAIATFSDDRLYRYTLERHWGGSGGICNFLMLNPSTADAFKLDPTVTRCYKKAQKMGASGIIVTNLFALRATDPKEMLKHWDPVGADNGPAILEAADRSDIVICAWGTHGSHLRQDEFVLSFLRMENTHKLWRIGDPTKHGHPKHPLYLAEDTPLQRMLI